MRARERVKRTHDYFLNLDHLWNSLFGHIIGSWSHLESSLLEVFLSGPHIFGSLARFILEGFVSTSGEKNPRVLPVKCGIASISLLTLFQLHFARKNSHKMIITNFINFRYRCAGVMLQSHFIE